MASGPRHPRALRAVSFDCWGTLIYEADRDASHGRRVETVVAVARAHGLGADPGAAREALDQAWRLHWTRWQEGVASGAPEIAGWTLDALAESRGAGAAPTAAAAELSTALAEAALDVEIRSLEGARRALEQLARAGLRRALICDTGLTPGRVVRQLLERQGLLEHLEVTLFSDEAGVPKPHPRMFQGALEALGGDLAPTQVVHVGDLRRTDVAGARGVGMGTVRIREHHDDRSDLPEADSVVDSHAELLRILGLDPEPDAEWDSLETTDRNGET